MGLILPNWNNNFIQSLFTWNSPQWNYGTSRVDNIYASPYKIKFNIKDKNNVVYWPDNEIVFDQTILPTVFTHLFSDFWKIRNNRWGIGYTNYMYKLTSIDNSAPNRISNRSWNTLLGSSSNSTNARCVAEAAFPDKVYKLHCEASNVQGLVTTDVVDPEIVIDNFKPYLKSILVQGVNSI